MGHTRSRKKFDDIVSHDVTDRRADTLTDTGGLRYCNNRGRRASVQAGDVLQTWGRKDEETPRISVRRLQ